VESRHDNEATERADPQRGKADAYTRISTINLDILGIPTSSHGSECYNSGALRCIPPWRTWGAGNARSPSLQVNTLIWTQIANYDDDHAFKPQRWAGNKPVADRSSGRYQFSSLAWGLLHIGDKGAHTCTQAHSYSPHSTWLACIYVQQMPVLCNCVTILAAHHRPSSTDPHAGTPACQRAAYTMALFDTLDVCMLHVSTGSPSFQVI